jgi:hypothetical protein
VPLKPSPKQQAAGAPIIRAPKRAESGRLNLAIKRADVTNQVQSPCGLSLRAGQGVSADAEFVKQVRVEAIETGEQEFCNAGRSNAAVRPTAGH